MQDALRHAEMVVPISFRSVLVRGHPRTFAKQLEKIRNVAVLDPHPDLLDRQRGRFEQPARLSNPSCDQIFFNRAARKLLEQMGNMIFRQMQLVRKIDGFKIVSVVLFDPLENILHMMACVASNRRTSSPNMLPLFKRKCHNETIPMRKWFE